MKHWLKSKLQKFLNVEPLPVRAVLINADGSAIATTLNGVPKIIHRPMVVAKEIDINAAPEETTINSYALDGFDYGVYLYKQLSRQDKIK